MKTILAFILIISTFISLAFSQADCPPCVSDGVALPADFSRTAPDGSGRRVVVIRIDDSWDVDTQGNSTPGHTNERVWNAVQGCPGCPPGALQRWNDARDPSGYAINYYFVLDQTAQNPAIIVRRQSPAGGGGWASNSNVANGFPLYINLDPRNGFTRSGLINST